MSDNDDDTISTPILYKLIMSGWHYNYYVIPFLWSLQKEVAQPCCILSHLQSEICRYRFCPIFHDYSKYNKYRAYPMYVRVPKKENDAFIKSLEAYYKELNDTPLIFDIQRIARLIENTSKRSKTRWVDVLA